MMAKVRTRMQAGVRALRGRFGRPETSPREAKPTRNEWATVIGDLVRPGPVKVAVLQRRAAAEISTVVLDRNADSSIVEIAWEENASRRHMTLSANGPFDLIIDDTGAPRGSARRLKDLLFHVRVGGSLVMRRANRYRRTDAGRELTALLRAAGRVNPHEGSPDELGPAGRTDAHSLSEAMESCEAKGPHLVFTSRVSDALIKLTEAEVDAVLEESGTPHEVLDVVPGITFESRCTLRESSPSRAVNQPTSYRAPDVRLREYQDVVVWPLQLVTSGRFILPDSFRHNAAARMRNSNLEDLAPRFGRAPDIEGEIPMLRGTWCHLDNELRGHFGHMMTEQISRMWAWEQVKAREPGVKALVTVNKGRLLRSWEEEIYAAAGVDPSDVVLLDHPVRVERLVSPGPLFSNPQYVHPEIQGVWRRIGDALSVQATRTEFSDRIFCSRRIAKRACNNTAEVEQLFADQGFEVVYPEDHSLGDQVRMFRAAEVIAGFAGSGLFQLALVNEPKRAILVSSERYTARNEYLMASLLGHSIDQAFCVPDDPDDFQSTFTFDHDREGRWLEGVFKSLG